MAFAWMQNIFAAPRLVLFVIFFELFQKFATFGFQSVLFLFLRHELKYSVYNSVGIYHMYVGMSYLVPVLGTIIADLYMNKVLAILLISVFGVIGQVIVVLAAIAVSGEETHVVPFVTDNIRFFVGLGLLLRAMGVGGFREVASSIDEGPSTKSGFLEIYGWRWNQFMQFLHYGIVIGMILAFTIPPALRMNVSCFGNGYCFPLALGIPGVGTVLVVIILMAGYRILNVPSRGVSVTIDFFAVIQAALYNACGGGAHWIDNASHAFHNEFLDEVKLTLHVLALYIPLPIFWALFEQMGSRWVMQGTRMETTVDAESNLYLEPEQMMVLNPLIVLVFLPIFEYWLFPLCMKARFIMATVKQRMFVGSVLAVAAFLWAGYIEYRNEATQVTFSQPGEGDLLLINPMGIGLEYTIVYTPTHEVTYTVPGLNLTCHRLPVVVSKPFNVSFYFVYPDCNTYTRSRDPPVPAHLAEQRVVSVSVSPVGSVPRGNPPPGPCYSADLPKTDAYYSNFDRCELQLARVALSYYTRRVHGVHETADFIYGNATFKMHQINSPLNRIRKYCDPNYTGVDFFDVRAGVYKIDNGIAGSFECRFKRGGVYMIIHNFRTKGACRRLTAGLNTNVTIWWQLPQYVLISFGQYLYPIMLLEYSLTQVPYLMKPVLWNAWLMSIALGNILVAILAFPNIFAREMYYYVLFASLMACNCLLLFILLWNYIPYYPSDRSEDDYDTDPSSSSRSAYSRSDSEDDDSGPNKRRVRFSESID